MSTTEDLYKRPLSFSRATQSWMYAVNPQFTLARKGVIEEILIGQYTEAGGLTDLGEWAICWHRLSSEIPTPQIEMFCDAWPVLAHPQVRRLWEWMTSRPTAAEATPDDVHRMLLELGFIDITPRELPQGPEAGWVGLRKMAQEIQALPPDDQLDAILHLLTQVEPKENKP